MSILILAGVSYNTMVYVDDFPEPVPQTLFARRYHETVGSSGAGKALNLVRLGVEVTLLGAIGDDRAGEEIGARLAAAGVQFESVLDPRGTKRHVNLMDQAGERISIFLEGGSQELAIPAARIDPLIAAAELVTVTIYNYTRPLLPRIAAAGKSLWCDIHDWDGQERYHQDYIDAAEVIQMSSANQPDYLRVMRRLTAAGKRFVVCTHGARGATGLDAAGRLIELPAYPVATLVDSNGAGDAFFAGLAWGHLQGLDWELAMRYGAAAASFSLGSSELASPELDESTLRRVVAGE